jgi:hypothetical protein
MPGMTDANLPVKRRDEEMELHEVLPEECPGCGCEHLYAKDDPEMLWEPGQAWGEACRDHQCSCHTSPVIGRRRDQDSVNPLDH